ncbi:glycosyltransferase family 2 protein [Aquimarina addita]|uniref:Glycosyltransferase family 2 protein n=1 Tax=Aquimarina addita TaxID=870485 RepID=A0ABP7X6S2_9FLAO
MKLSVIILNYNVRYFLELCILSVKKALTTIEAEIIIIDNNSQDDSCKMVQQHFPEITLLQNNKNVGFAKANNQGVAMATGEYICILNPDTVVAEDTFVKILEASQKLLHMGMVGTRLIDGTGSFLPESKRNIPSPMTSFRRLFGIRIGHVKNYYADHISETETADVEILVGAFLFMKKEAYESVNGFDEDYFMYGEDIDLSYKILKQGLQNYYVGSVPVIHYKGESTDRNAAYIKRFYGAMRLFYSKHFRSNWLLDSMVAFGIRIIAIQQSFKNQEKEKRVIDHHYLVSDNPLLQQKIAQVLKKDIQLISLESVQDLGDMNNELIFDNEYLTFSEIIGLMEQQRDTTQVFKIRPEGCNYILGSNYSDGKGEVIVF